MTGPLRERWERLVGFVRGHRADHDLNAELDAHIEIATDDYMRDGLSPADARRLAAMKFGSRLSAEDHANDQRGLPSLDALVTDLRYAVRSLRKSPGFATAAVAMLALGIGVNAAVFTVSNAVLFKGYRSIDRNDRILYVGTQLGCCVSYPDFEDWRSQTKSFDGLGAVADLRITLSDYAGSAESATATLISANGFRMLRQTPMLGRDFMSSDDALGAAPVAILSYSLWEGRFARDPAVVGRTVRINNIPTTVIGVMNEGFSFPQNQALWLPLVPTADRRVREARDLWFAFGRLADDATIERARAEMDVIGRRLASLHPTTNRGVAPIVQTFQQFFISPNAPTIYGALWGAVGFVLLIACANLANLLLARSMVRSREISVRMALGAGRWRIIRQLLIESVVLSIPGGVCGWWVAKACVRAYELFANPPGQAWSVGLVNFSMDNRVVAYLVAMSIGTGLLFGLAPALRLSRVDINRSLKDGGHGAAGAGRGRRLSALLVIAEMALAVVLLAGAGVMIRSFLKIYSADLGFNAGNILTGMLQLPDARYARADAQTSFYDRLAARLESTPGIESVAITSALPGSARSVQYELPDAPAIDAPRRPRVATLVISPSYFRTLGAAIKTGRAFTDADHASGEPVVIVNQRFAKQLWPTENALGQRLRLYSGQTPGAWLTVVGVAPDMGQNGPLRLAYGVSDAIDPLVYVPYRQQAASSMWVLMRTRVPPADLSSAFRYEVQSLDRELPIWIGPVTLTERLAGAYWERGVSSGLLLIFAAIALLLSSIGLAAVVAHSVSQRTREIGVRIAIGATSRDVLTLVLMQGLLPAGIGLVIGLAGSLAVNRLLQSQLVQVSPADPLTFGVASVVLVVSATLGCWIPARRAMRVDPLVALRHE